MSKNTISPLEFSNKLNERSASAGYWATIKAPLSSIVLDFEQALYWELVELSLIKPPAMPAYWDQFIKAPAKRYESHIAWMLGEAWIMEQRQAYTDLNQDEKDWLDMQAKAVSRYYEAGELAGDWWWVGRFEAVRIGGKVGYEEATLTPPYSGPVALTRLTADLRQTTRRVPASEKLWLRLIMD